MSNGGPTSQCCFWQICCDGRVKFIATISPIIAKMKPDEIAGWIYDQLEPIAPFVKFIAKLTREHPAA